MTQDIAAPASEEPAELVRLRAECDRLAGCLDRANDSAEHFERKWYLAQDELEKLQEEQATANARPYRPDAKRVDSGDWVRACGQSICEVCGYQYWEHAPVHGFAWDSSALRRKADQAVSPLFRVQLVLMLLGKWGFGDHVTDPRAFVLRLRGVLR